MMDILAFLELVQEKYPSDPPRPMQYFDNAAKQRLGQAFMNSIRETPYYDQLTGSLYDPFYKDETVDIMNAIEFIFR